MVHLLRRRIIFLSQGKGGRKESGGARKIVRERESEDLLHVQGEKRTLSEYPQRMISCTLSDLPLPSALACNDIAEQVTLTKNFHRQSSDIQG